MKEFINRLCNSHTVFPIIKAIIVVLLDLVYTICQERIIDFFRSILHISRKKLGRFFLIFLALVNITLIKSALDDGSILPSPSPSPIIETEMTYYVGDSIDFGTYKQTQDGEKWVRERISWNILAVEDDHALLLSEDGLIYKEISNIKDEWKPWSNCSLNKWLNEVFYKDAFSPEEQQIILKTDDSIGRVFCLSKQEVEDYFLVKNERICKPTEYAIADCQDNDPTKYGKQPTPIKDADYWWLRDHGSDTLSFLTVSDEGEIHVNGTQGKYEGIMVRPAIWVDIQAMNRLQQED